MKTVDKNINRTHGIRALTAEIVNFIDGQRTISDISECVGHEFAVNLDPSHVYEFLVKAKQKGYVNF